MSLLVSERGELGPVQHDVLGVAVHGDAVADSDGAFPREADLTERRGVRRR